MSVPRICQNSKESMHESVFVAYGNATPCTVQNEVMVNSDQFLAGHPRSRAPRKWRRTHLISDSTTSFTSVGGLILSVLRGQAQYKVQEMLKDGGQEHYRFDARTMRRYGSGLGRRVRHRVTDLRSCLISLCI